jgi:hypothetical protein
VAAGTSLLRRKYLVLYQELDAFLFVIEDLGQLINAR